MIKFEFRTDDPVNAAPRSMDIVRKMNLPLRRLTINIGPKQDEAATVSIEIEQGSTSALTNLGARLLQMPSVCDLGVDDMDVTTGLSTGDAA